MRVRLPSLRKVLRLVHRFLIRPCDWKFFVTVRRPMVFADEMRKIILSKNETVLFRILLVPALLAGFACGALAQGNHTASVDQYLSRRSAIGGFSGAVLIAVNDKVILRKGYGYADVENKIRFRPETRHEVASLSKMFTAMAALKLRDQGKLQLEDFICKYISPCPDSWTPVTVHHLMRNSSGIPDYEEPLELGSAKYFEFMTREDASATIFENARKLPLDFKPGSQFKYSNTGYLVLGYVIQKAAAEPFAQYVTRAILKPAKIAHSGVIGFGASPKNLAYGYTFGDIGWEKLLGGVPHTDLTRVPRLPLTPPEGDAWLYSGGRPLSLEFANGRERVCASRGSR
jgi:CubicO group peptidase (beta-lactamase class C family)